MNKSSFLISITILFLSGCATKKTVVLNYEHSNPVRVEASAKKLEISNLLSTVSEKIDGTIAIQSIELWDGADEDHSVMYLVEDNIITNLIENGYRVVERDPDILQELYKESNTGYKKPNPSYESIANDKTDDENTSTATAISGGGTVVNININDDENTDSENDKNNEKESEFKSTDLSSADYILSYRVLECGISYRDLEDETGSGFNISDYTSEELERTAKTRLHCRLTNTKTSEILAAGILDGEVVDIVDAEDVNALRQVPHDFYFHTLPLMNSGEFEESSGYKSTDDPVIVEKASDKPENRYWLYALGGLFFLATAD